MIHHGMPAAGTRARSRRSGRIAAAAALAVIGATLSPVTAGPAGAVTAPVGAGFSVTPADLAYILKQIKIAEAHVANTTAETGPCGALLGDGPYQIPNPLLSFGLRTVDGSCNNLQPGRERFNSSDEPFPRLTTPEYRDAEMSPAVFGPPRQTTYKSTNGNIFDSRPRLISNLIVDQTSTNPAAVAAAAHPVRTQNNPGVYACGTEGAPAPPDCVPPGETLFIPNVTTDVGLSPPFNSLFTLFGQFFDHGLDLVSKSGGTVFVPLRGDDPLMGRPDLDPHAAFMVLTRATNQPGPDGIVGTADDERNGTNLDAPLVDQSQTYSSHPSHQVFLREYVDNVDGVPVSTGRLLGPTPDDPHHMATWAMVKEQARTLLGLELSDQDVLNIPMIAADPYGKFIPGPHGLPQYVTKGADGAAGTADDGLREGNIAAPVPVGPDVIRVGTAFLDDIAHHAVPGVYDDDNNRSTPPVAQKPDADTDLTIDDNDPSTYDDEMLAAHFCTGDGRTNENIGLTMIHQIFHSEHDRLVGQIKQILVNDTSAKGLKALTEWKLDTGANGWNGERLFQAAKFITEMEYQHLVFEEFARKIQPLIEPFAVYHDNIDAQIDAEFAHAVYRFGHSMLTDTIPRINEIPSGNPTNRPRRNDIALLDAFTNPPAYTEDRPGGPTGALSSAEAAGSLAMGLSDQTGNEIDEFVTDTLRNNLLGLPLDLATINIARARETGVPSLNNLRKQIYADTDDASLKPYTNWVDFGMALKHPESLVNFVAAYGTYPTIRDSGPDGILVDDESTLSVDEAADNVVTVQAKREAAAAIVNNPAPTADESNFMFSHGPWANTADGVSLTGLDDVDLWVGGLAERTNLFGGLLGSTFNYVFEQQLTKLQNGDRFYYLIRAAGMNLLSSLESNSFAEMIMRNTNAHTLKQDAFATADCKFELSNLAGTAEGFTASGSTVADDPGSECNETNLLIRMPDGTIRYRTTNVEDPAGINGQSVYNGTAGVDRIWGGVDNDTFMGNEDDDVIEGNDGADVVLGGDGDDRVNDLAGDDVLKGGPGDDALDAGPGLDLILGNEGADFTNGGLNTNETFGGPGGDFIQAGGGNDTVFGDSGDDWIEGGDGQDLLCGDSCAPFFDDPNKAGNDVFVGQNGEEDYDMEGGDDIAAADAGIERNAGAGGYDWTTYQYDTLPADADLTLGLLGIPLPAVVFRDRYQEVEAMSGYDKDDVLRGDDVVPAQVGGAGFTGCDALDQAGVDRIAGLDALLPPLTTPLSSVPDSTISGCPLEGDVWGAGNILLGGAGSDTLEGRGADDVLDGDAYLQVRLSVRSAEDHAVEIGSTDLMEHTYQAGNPRSLQQDVFAGVVRPGQIEVVRSIVSNPNPDDVDVAVFTGNRLDYSVTTDGDAVTVTDESAAAGGAVGEDGGGGGGAGGGARGNDGTDTLRNVELLQFADQTMDLRTGIPVPAGRPLAPTIGTATGGDAQATVTWQPPANDGGSPLVAYRIVVSDGTNETTVLVSDPAATSAVVTGLVNDTSYTFQVVAVNALADSEPSAPSNAVRPAAGAPGSGGGTTDPPPADPQPVAPQAPAIGSAVAGNGTATVTWTAPASNGGSALTGFRVQVLAGTTLVRTVTVFEGTAAGTLIAGLENGTAYTFKVIAINAVGESEPSTASNVVTPTAPVTPPPSDPGPVTPPPSDPGPVTPPPVQLAVPGAPTIGRATAGDASAELTWSAPASDGGSPLTGYRVEVRSGGSVIRTIDGVGAGATALAITGLENRTGYTFRVAAQNAVGTSPWSAGSEPVTPRRRRDGVAPEVIRLRPSEGAREARPGVTVRIRMSEPVTGVSGRTVKLRNPRTHRQVKAVVTLSDNGRVLRLDPRHRLAHDTRYRVTLRGGRFGVTDLSGEPLSRVRWVFRTR